MKKEAVKEITENEFSNIINDKKNNLVIVDFFASWCSPCTMISPIIERLAEKFTKVKFAKVNVDDASNLAKEYEI